MSYGLMSVALALCLLLIACGEPADTASIRDRNGGGDDTPTADAGIVDCGGSKYDPAGLADAPQASTLPAGPADAVDDMGEPAFDPSQDWKVVHQSEDRVDLIRELDEPFDLGEGDVRTHESVTLERVTGATNVPEGTWMLMSAGPCTQRLPAGDNLGEADLTLAQPPSPDDTSIDLLVHERACASGQSAEGRIELIELDETAQQVRVRIGVRPPAGDAQTCQGNPPTPFTVELTQPLGQREVIDTSVVPPRPVTLGGDQ